VHRGLSSIGTNRSGTFAGTVMPIEAPEPFIERLPTDTSIGEVRMLPTSGPGMPTSTAGFLLGMLAAVSPTSEDLRSEQGILLGKAQELGDTIDAFVSAVVEERLTTLEKQHAAIREAGRKQLALVENLNGKFLEANGFWNSAREAKQIAFDNLSQADWAMKHLSQFATDKDIEDAANRRNNAQVLAEEAALKESEQLQRRNEAGDRLSAAQQELQRIAIEEVKLRGRLTGEPFVDPETGLTNRVTAITRD
jgi:hypothetical protein